MFFDVKPNPTRNRFHVTGHAFCIAGICRFHDARKFLRSVLRFEFLRGLSRSFLRGSYSRVVFSSRRSLRRHEGAREPKVNRHFRPRSKRNAIGRFQHQTSFGCFRHCDPTWKRNAIGRFCSRQPGQRSTVELRRRCACSHVSPMTK